MTAAENGKIPDSLVRMGIRRLLRKRIEEETESDCEAQQQRLMSFIELARQSPIALLPEKANEQHYEVPASFFQMSLGTRRKYSCCYWPAGTDSLDDAETAALQVTCQRAELQDGLSILELGCGWGSLSLWMAQNYPNSRITAVSNSASQREYIESQAADRGLANLTVVTADMNDFQIETTFDRVVSVEMFEHMRNYELLMRRVAGWLNPDGKLFVHIFCHKSLAYEFKAQGPSDWMGRYFFSGGTMPSDDLLLHFQKDVTIANHWRWDGRHYEKTSNAWLALMDVNKDRILPLFCETYGDDQAMKWFMRWRIFHMACAELFGYSAGQEWWVSHYLFEKNRTNNL
ncbi:UNVERIFIED_CONTAM: hypothetical protein GTU68_040224 [Idotea baltica]|nr:hypothetical protein [Idotea baltica]